MLTLVESFKIDHSTLRVIPPLHTKLVGTIGSAPDINRNCRISKLALNSSGLYKALSKSRPLYCSRRHLKNEYESHVSRASSSPAVDLLTHVFDDHSYVVPLNLCLHRDRSGIDRYPAVYAMSRTGRLLRKQLQTGTR